MQNSMSLQIPLDDKLLKINGVILNLNRLDISEFSSNHLNTNKTTLCYSNLIFLSDTVDFKLVLADLKAYIFFNTPEFFDENLLNSKILKKFKNKYCLEDNDFIVKHATVLMLKPQKTNWNKVEFTYDPKQGDISLELY